jgi:hypothetical protein
MSDKITNVKRHIVSRHSAEKTETTPKDEILSSKDEILSSNDEILSSKDEILSSKDEILSSQDQNIVMDSGQIKCDKCYKMLSSALVLKRHSKVCKGITTPLECNKCHRIFANPSSKCIHMKKCTGPPPPAPTIQNISNITNNNIDQSQNANTINNNNTTNNITNNLIVYNSTNIEFDDSHITKRDLKRIFNGIHKKTIESIVQYGQKLLENMDNRCVEKKHVTNAYCRVHVGDNKWEQRPDTPIIDRFSQDVAISANDKLYVHPEIGKTELRDEIAELASYPEQVHTNAINLRREMRTLLLNTSNDVNNKN